MELQSATFLHDEAMLLHFFLFKFKKKKQQNKK